MTTCKECDGSGMVPTCKDKCLGEGCKNEHNCGDCPEYQNFETCKICEGDGEVSDEYAEELDKANKYDERRADR